MSERSERPAYDSYTALAQRIELGEVFARQILATVRPWIASPDEIDVLDVGSGYGGTAFALSRHCRSVVGMEPALALHESASKRIATTPHGRLRFVHGNVEALEDVESYDLVVLDNVYEHVPDHDAALRCVRRALRPGGVVYILVPNRLWPIEAHYRLPFLAWLPLRVANFYLRCSGRGTDYRDASYAPTYWSLRRLLRRHGFEVEFRLPGEPAATMAGSPLHYRLGMRLLACFPVFWCLSKALLVVAVKPTRGTREISILRTSCR